MVVAALKIIAYASLGVALALVTGLSTVDQLQSFTAHALNALHLLMR
jgi:hypothetical protein